jgi:hypothetical protein
LVPRGGEAEQSVCPVVNAQNTFFKKSTHLIFLGFGRNQSPNATRGM